MINIPEIQTRLNILDQVARLCAVDISEGHLNGDEKKPKIYTVSSGTSILDLRYGSFKTKEEAEARKAEIDPFFFGFVDEMNQRVTTNILKLLTEGNSKLE